MIGPIPIEVTGQPITATTLEQLIKGQGTVVDLVLKYVDEGNGKFLMYARYEMLTDKQITSHTRQIVSQRKLPREFALRNFKRAIVWAKRMNFRSVSLSVNMRDIQEGDETFEQE